MNTKEIISSLGLCCVCDKTTFGPPEKIFMSFLDEHNVSYEKAENMLISPKDLSQYQTLAFFTTGFDQNVVKNFSYFDKSKLRYIIALNSIAYNLSKPLISGLDIKLIFSNLKEKIFQELPS